ncbi:MAG: SGNH/GDSL hydrolase family protein [Bryobacteraceae bacterium]
MNYAPLIVFAALVIAAQYVQAGEHWVGTWSTAAVGRPQQPVTPPPQGTSTTPPPAPLTINNQTLRQIVHVSVGGSRVRVMLTNALGTAPLTVGAAFIALRDKDSKIAEASGHALNFGGRPSVTIPAGAIMLSDAVDLVVPAMTDLAIDLFLPDNMIAATSPLSSHFAAAQTNYVSSAGNFAGVADLPGSATMLSWYFLERVEVTAPDPVNAIVTFGDSITDGTRSTPNTNSRWPDVLAKRLLANPGTAHGILNEAIAGNRLLTEATIPFGLNALSRFDRDVLAQTGVAYVIVLEGINDIGMARQSPSPTSADIIAAHRQLVERAHARGLKIFGATLTPFDGAAYFSAEGEAKREAFNNWLRSGKDYDAVIDFDAATRDPQNPTKLLPLYDSGDHLHPNDAGYLAMGNAIDLTLFETHSAPAAKSKKK